VLAFLVRTWGLADHFWLLGDQIRDWGIALGPFRELPLVGPPTHVGGYSLGPASYWLMWAIRVVLGPWFDNLPHAGGYGQALIESAADALLFAAIWRRVSGLVAVTFALLVITAPYDVALSAIVWTSPVCSAFLKCATALVLFDWHRRSAWRIALIAALCWAAVQIHTAGIFVAAGLFAAIFVDSIVARGWNGVSRTVIAWAAVVGVMQIPYAAHQLLHRDAAPGMGAVTASIGSLVTGRQTPQLEKSVNGYVAAIDVFQSSPWYLTWLHWVLGLSAIVCALRFYRDPVLLGVVLLPQAAAIVGYSLYLDVLDHYNFLSVVPLAVLMVLLAAIVPQRSWWSRTVGLIVVVAALAIVPARLRQAALWHRMPEYHALVKGSRRVAAMEQPMRDVRTAFPLLPTSNPAFLYTILGGRIDPTASWIAVIQADGSVQFTKADP
jgi:hypothetical protein